MDAVILHESPDSTLLLNLCTHREMLMLAAQYGPEPMAQRQSEKPLSYTLGLAKSRRLREPSESQMAIALGQQLQSILEEKATEVFELGPGAVDFLYKMIGGTWKECVGPNGTWKAGDINQRVTSKLKRLFRSDPHHQATTIDFADAQNLGETFDLGIGLCSLDSAYGQRTFDGLAAIIKPGGHLVHVQDLPPSQAVLHHFLAKDPRVEKYGLVYLVQDLIDGHGPITHILHEDDTIIPSHMYLHFAIAEEMQARDFKVVSQGNVTYNGLASTPFALTNFRLAIDVEDRIPLNESCHMSDHYAYLIMQKTNGKP